MCQACLPFFFFLSLPHNSFLHSCTVFFTLCVELTLICLMSFILNLLLLSAFPFRVRQSTSTVSIFPSLLHLPLLHQPAASSFITSRSLLFHVPLFSSAWQLHLLLPVCSLSLLFMCQNHLNLAALTLSLRRLTLICSFFNPIHPRPSQRKP